MRLEGRNKKLVIYCTYQERDFPKFLKGRWDKKLKAWAFIPSILVYTLIQEEAKKRNIELHISKDVKEFFNKKKEGLKEFEVNGKLKTEPRNYQKKTTNLIIQKKKAFVFAGVGTGKSKSSIDAVSYLYKMIADGKGEVRKCLVVSPSSIMWNFSNEVKKHSYFDCTVIHGTLAKRKQLMADSQTVFDILNYEMLEKMAGDIKKKHYDMVIFDEVHYCKSRNSSRSLSSYDISRDIKIRIGLTGTIISNSYEDLFMPYKIIDESIFGPHYTRFKERYLITANWSGYDELIGYKNEEELKRLVASNSIKYEIRDVINDLPSEQNIIKTICLNDKSRKLYRDLKNNMKADYESGEVVANNVLERLIRLSQVTSGYLVDKQRDTIEDIGSEKLDVLEETLSGIKEKTIIWCRFKRSIDRVAELCKKIGKSYYIYDGRTKEKGLYLKFNTDNTDIWIAQLQKSEGYSIDSAQYSIFYEIDYSNVNHNQARGRILRATGSEHSCLFYIYLIAENTIDEKIYQDLKHKGFTSRQALEYVSGAE